MGISSGSVSYLRFVADPVPDGFEEPYCDALREHRFREIDLHGDLDKQSGWVQFDDAFAADWDPDTLVSRTGMIFLRLRVDTLTIPAVTLKAYTDLAARQRQTELGRDKLIKRETDALKLEVKKALRKRSLPRMQLLEIVWNVATGEVRLMSTARAGADLFSDLFEKTFGQKLHQVGLLNVLRLRGLDDAAVDGLALLEPERFHLIRR